MPETNFESSSDLLTELPRRYDLISILAIVHEVPDWLYDHTGDIAIVCEEAADRRFAGPRVHILRAESISEIKNALATAQRAAAAPFNLVYIKHDHRMVSLIEQINGALKVSSPETLFIFDDAVPPSIKMARSTPDPNEPWFVGEVWMLTKLLKAAGDGFFVITCDIAPTGLMACAGFRPLVPAEMSAEYDNLGRLGTDSELRQIFGHVSPDEFFEAADMALDTSAKRDFMHVSAGRSADPLLASTEVIDPETAWSKPSPKFVIDMSGGGLNTRSLYRSDRKMHGKFLDSFEDAFVVGSSGILKHHTFFSHNREVSGFILDELAQNHGSYGNFGSGFRLLNEDVVLDRQQLNTAERVDGPVFFATPDEYDNWGMWLLLAIPAAFEFMSRRSQFQGFMCSVTHAWQRALLQQIGLQPEDLIAHDIGQTYLCDRVSRIRHSWRDLAVTPSDKAIFNSIGERNLRSNEAGPERLFVSRITRTRQGSYRGLLNEAELEAGLKKLDFVTVEPEFLTFSEQVTAFASAKTVVGLGGAGMFNTLFCRDGTFVIDLEGGLDFVDAHTTLFSSMGLDYGVLLGKEDPTDPRADQKRWSVDVDEALQVISEFV